MSATGGPVARHRRVRGARGGRPRDVGLIDPEGQSPVPAATQPTLEPTVAAQVQTYLADALGRCDSASSDWQLQATDGLPGKQPVLALTEDYLEEGVQSVVGSVRESGVVTSVSVERRGTPDEVSTRCAGS